MGKRETAVANPRPALIRERLFCWGIFLLPLVWWPGLERPFSVPKTWLLACLDVGLALPWLLRGPAPQWPWFVWLGTLALSAVLAPYVSLEALILILLPLPLCWAMQQGRVAAAMWKQAVLWGSAVESVIVLMQFAGVDPLRWTGWQPEAFSTARMRVYGTLGNPDFVAAWLCATLPLHSYGAVRRRVPAVLLFLLQLGAILATGSRVFLLALPAAALALAISRGRWKRWLLAGVPLAAAILLLSPARPLDVTVQGRLYFARVIAGHWMEIPAAGYGPGSFAPQFALWQADWLRQHAGEPDSRKFAGDLDHAHNDYLELWTEYGWLGLAVFLGLCGWWIAAAWRGGTRDSGIWGALAALAAIACVDFPLHRPAESALFWMLLGIAGNREGLISTRNQKEKT